MYQSGKISSIRSASSETLCRAYGSTSVQLSAIVMERGGLGAQHADELNERVNKCKKKNKTIKEGGGGAYNVAMVTTERLFGFCLLHTFQAAPCGTLPQAHLWR